MTASQELMDFALHLARIAAAEILPHFRSRFEIDNKASAGFDPVTIADRNAEAAIRREIKRVYPRHGVLGEEFGLERGEDPLTWVIDPIDGTRAFILGQLHWGTLIALRDESKPFLGLMHQPFTGETFIGSTQARTCIIRGDSNSCAVAMESLCAMPSCVQPLPPCSTASAAAPPSIT